MAARQNSKDSFGGASKGAPFYIYLLMAASVLIFILWPTVCILKGSVYFDGAFSLEHYRNLLVINRTLLKNSLVVGFWTTILALFIGVCCALYITHTSFKAKKALVMVLLLTMISPPFVSSLA